VSVKLKGKKRRAAEGEAKASGTVGGEVDVDDKKVPEWRKKRSGSESSFDGGRRASKFQSCEESVRKSLVDTQAQRYIAENEAAVIRAKNQVLRMEEDSRRVAARLKTGVTEQNVELQRLKLNEKMKVHAAAFYEEHGIGFAETVVTEGLDSVFSVPSSGSGCVSPDSSVSVVMVKKMEMIIKSQAAKVTELEKKLMRCGVEVEVDEVNVMTGKPMDALGLPIEEVADENMSPGDYQEMCKNCL